MNGNIQKFHHNLDKATEKISVIKAGSARSVHFQNNDNHHYFFKLFFLLKPPSDCFTQIYYEYHSKVEIVSLSEEKNHHYMNYIKILNSILVKHIVSHTIKKIDRKWLH